ncbi:hypothetical protein BVC80_8917g21 [Macleaya cordata]|uniref:Uncharacterized protein n=1 Tax=Macleaya cordata TaxID=56857 RepID=A0A200QRR5_MACCD|nr:hypothetical protein BVC80_8917g21 [Macleaya cordata]
MKVEEIQKTPQLPKSDKSMPSSSFSFEADSLLSFSFEADSLPVELQDKLKKLQNVGNVLIECNNEITSIQEDVQGFDLSLKRLAKKRDGLRGGVLKKREECLNAKEENLNNVVNALLRVNDEFMRIQQELTDSRAGREVVAQRVVRIQEKFLKLKEEYLEGKDLMMQAIQLVVGKQNADD